MPGAETWLRVASLVGELAELSVVDLGQTMDHLLRGACEIIGAGDAVLGFAVRDPDHPADDPLNGWRPPSPYRPRRFGPHAERDGALLSSWYGSASNPPLDAGAVAVSRGGGRVRAVMHGDVMDERGWQRAPIHELFDASRIADRLIGGRPITPALELMLVLYRRAGEEPFGEEERARLRMIMAALAGVGRRLALAHGLIDARRPLTGRERETLHYLLRGLSEKQIAGMMGLSERTLHHHVTAIFQKYAVQSRAEFMALFLASGSARGQAEGASSA